MIDIVYKNDHTKTVPAKSGLISFSSFREFFFFLSKSAWYKLS